MDLGSDEESISSKKSVSFGVKTAKNAAKSTVASKEVSSFSSKTFKRLIEEPTSGEEEDNLSLSAASNSSEATTVTSNKSKSDSRTSSLTKETFETRINGFAQGLQLFMEAVNEQRELDKRERESDKKAAAEQRELDKKERETGKKEAAAILADINQARRLQQIDNEEFQRQQERDKQATRKFQMNTTLQETSQRSTHQPTDAAARDDFYTPTGRRPHGSDAAPTNPSNKSGVGQSL